MLKESETYMTLILLWDDLDEATNKIKKLEDALGKDNVIVDDGGPVFIVDVCVPSSKMSRVEFIMGGLSTCYV